MASLFNEEIVSVLVPIPGAGPYSYAVPEDMQVAPGDYVLVPLGPRQVVAVVWDQQSVGDVDASKLRQIEQRFDCPPMKEELRRFIEWIANYTISPAGMVLKMVLRVPSALEPLPPIMGLQYAGVEPERMTTARGNVLELARNGLAWTKSGLAHAAGVTPAVVDGLRKQGVFNVVPIPHPPIVGRPDPEHVLAQLNEEQLLAANQLQENLEVGGFEASLIDGVTGSGKTEVYFEAVASALKKGQQVLILLPEIALTGSFIDRFEKRFGAAPAEWHSDISPKNRERIWREVATGDVRVVAGARSALFLPFDDLGLIVVDEEHEPAYKQEDRVYYNARDMAVVRASLLDIPVVLASATPSLESRVNADQNRYQHLVLSKRFAEAELPNLKTVDLRSDPPPRGKFLSPILTDAIKTTLEKQQQAMLFLNRRGYAPLTLCRVCGHRFHCNNCSTWLVEHRFRRQLQCHQCGHHEPTPEACPECGTLDHLVACGPGVERLAEEVLEIFPDARTIVLSSDMAGGTKRLKSELEYIAKGDADIVIGTQLVAKGHNFPFMTCVGVVDADLGLAHGDLRAAERTFQLLSQVTGRAGRAGGESIGLLQSYLPEHPVIDAIRRGDRDAFYEREVEGRQRAGMPPFGRLAGIIISATEKPAAEGFAKELRRNVPIQPEVSVLGPAEAPLSLIRGRFRYRLLVHATRRADIQGFIRKWFKEAPKPRGSVRVNIDIDPQSFV